MVNKKKKAKGPSKRYLESKKSKKEVCFYPFSLGIPWKVVDKIVVPEMIKMTFINYVKRNPAREKSNDYDAPHDVNVLLPGFLAETLVLPMVRDVLALNDIKVSKWLVPPKYNEFTTLFGLNYEGTDGVELFEEYSRLKDAAKEYPTPMFFDELGNVYLNLMFNYGSMVDFENLPVGVNTKPFWKQLLDNTCAPCSTVRLDKPNFGLLNDMRKMVFDKYRFREGWGYVIIDNSNMFGELPSGKEVSSAKFFVAEEIATLVKYFERKKMHCVIMSQNMREYNSPNIASLPTWAELDFTQLAVLLRYADTLITPDPNLYIPAAVLGCKRILTTDKDIWQGWRFEDIMPLCSEVEGKRWVHLTRNSMTAIMKGLNEG